MSQSLFTVSIYDVLGPSTTEYIINHSELTCVFASLPHTVVLLKLKPQLPSLKFIVCLDPIDGDELKGCTKRDMLNSLADGQEISIYTINEVEDLGASLNRPCNPPSPEDVVTINYTSGTTGPPKGVVLTHKNAIAAVSCALIRTTTIAGDGTLSYLPLAHIYERLAEQLGFWGGARIGFFHGELLELVDDLKTLRPTAFASVPRLYSRFGNAIRSSTVEAPGFRGSLSRHVVATKTVNLKNPDPSKATAKHALYDRIWSRKVAAALGLDRAKIMVSGSAPLDPELQAFLRVVLGKGFIQGYGLTETYGICTSQHPDDLTSGNVGGVVPAVEVCR
jgi:long-chain acyl-CoA synthetase